MRTLRVEAASRESATSLSMFMSAFAPTVEEAEDGGYTVEVPVDGSRGQIVAVLNALERYVSDHGRRAHVVLDGRDYTLIAAD